MFKLRSALFLVVAAGLAAGCGGGGRFNSKISGKVTYKGQPLKGGNVTFHSDNGMYNAVIMTDGHYEAVDLPTGTMVVTIETESFNPDKESQNYGGGGKNAGIADAVAKQRAERMKNDPAASGAAGAEGRATSGAGFGAAPKSELLKLYTKIPARYADKRTSGLQVNIQSGNNTKDFELTD